MKISSAMFMLKIQTTRIFNYAQIVSPYFFLLSNILLLSLLTAYGENPYIELIKLFEVLVFLLFVFLLFKKLHKSISIILASLLYFFYLVMQHYYIVTKIDLDYSFLLRNMAYTGPIVSIYLGSFLVYFIVALLNSFALDHLSKKLVKYNKFLLPGLALLIFMPFISALHLPVNKLNAFAASIFDSDRVTGYYGDFYDVYLKRSENSKTKILTKAGSLKNEKLPDYLDNIVFLQLESLNSSLVNASNTPNLLKLAERGLFIPEFYANGVHTLLGQENILCSLPNSLDVNLVQSGRDKNVLCLPRVFNELGYKSFFLKSYSLDFTRTGEFMKNIGFNEVHADDIMADDDPRSKWGYREDVFYQRAFEYFKKNKQKDKNFLYIEIGPTNHWPFETPLDLSTSVPYPDPKNLNERLSNTTYIQDQYLEDALLNIDSIFPKKNYTLFVVTDHSWPTGVHAKNYFNQAGSFEENFLSSLVVVAGEEEKYQGRVINKRYSSMDIMPSLLGLAGINMPMNDFTGSFLVDSKEGYKKKTILIQPYSSKTINVVDNLIKYQYRTDSESIIQYDLTKDPLENEANTLGNDEKNNLNILKNILPLLENKKVVMHALGGIDGNDYTNSLEALEFNYERGRRVFEIDIALSSDNELILSHENPVVLNTISLENFLSKKINLQYTPLSFNDILKLMGVYEDITLILDVKSGFKDTYPAIVKAIGDQDENLYERIVPQIYFEDNLNFLQNLYRFPEVIYTLYRTNSPDDIVLDFAKNNQDIKTVAMFQNRFNINFANELRDNDIEVFIYTVNKERDIKKLILNGVDGIYSDFY